jgi:2-C-methyl-D-erythritol 4-phosphate cytidylyltransferase
MKYDVIITAAGGGTRSKLPFNKVFLAIGGIPCFMHSLTFFLAELDVGIIYLAIDSREEDQFLAILGQHNIDLKRVKLVYGGLTRQQSVFAALKLVKAEKVFVHDGARPFINYANIQALKQTLIFEKAAILAVQSTDTLKEIDAFKQINRTINRTKIYYAQTPQAFNTDILYAAHTLAELEQFEATDDAQLLEYEGSTNVQIVNGSHYNMKITTPEDIEIAQIYHIFLTEKKEGI